MTVENRLPWFTRNVLMPAVRESGRKTLSTKRKDCLVESVLSGAVGFDEITSVYGIPREDFMDWRVDYLSRRSKKK